MSPTDAAAQNMSEEVNFEPRPSQESTNWIGTFTELAPEDFNKVHNAFLNVRKATLKVNGKELVKDVSFDLTSGQTLAIMGPSGAGKTVLMDLLTLEEIAYNPLMAVADKV